MDVGIVGHDFEHLLVVVFGNVGRIHLQGEACRILEVLQAVLFGKFGITQHRLEALQAIEVVLLLIVDIVQTFCHSKFLLGICCGNLVVGGLEAIGATCRLVAATHVVDDACIVVAAHIGILEGIASLLPFLNLLVAAAELHGSSVIGLLGVEFERLDVVLDGSLVIFFTET